MNLQQTSASSARGPAGPAASVILRDPAFQRLVSERSRFAWTLSVVMIVVYLAFIVLVAFAHDTMATVIGNGPVSLGIVLGFVLIVFAFLLTGVYVSRANTRFDELTRAIGGGPR